MGTSSKEQPKQDNVDATSLALDRTVLANERTYTAWIRTGLAALVTGLGIARFMMETMPPWSIRIITLFLILFSAVAFLTAAWRYESLRFGMRHLDVKTMSPLLVKTISVVLAGCSFFSLIGVWSMMRG